MSTSTRAPVNEEEFLGSLYKGGELLAAGKIVEARGHLEKAHLLAPRNEKAQNLLGLTYFKLGLFDRASAIYEKLVNENPADPTLRVNLGLVYLKTNNLPRCIKEFETATDLEPDHKKAHNYLGLALAQAGDYAKAREHFVLAGSEQMADKMARALSAKVESAPSSHGLVVPPPPPATATAVTAQPAAPLDPPLLSHASPPRPPPVPRQTFAIAVAPPLPPPADEEIEVMSDDDAEPIDAGAESASLEAPPPAPEPAFEPPQELPPSDGAFLVEERPPLEATEAMPSEAMPSEAAPAEAASFEPMPEEVEIAPPAPSGPRLERDWGAQFGMDAAPPQDGEQPIVEGEELPVVDAVAVDEAPQAESGAQKSWATPLVNSWDAPSGLTPPATTEAPAAEAAPLDDAGRSVTHELPSNDDAWNAARRSAVVEAPAQDSSWNVPPDPAQEMDFGDVAPGDAAPPVSETATWASSAEPVSEAPPTAEDPRWSQSTENMAPADVPAGAEDPAWTTAPETPVADAPPTAEDPRWSQPMPEAAATESWAQPQELPPPEPSPGATWTEANEGASAQAWSQSEPSTTETSWSEPGDAVAPTDSWSEPQDFPPVDGVATADSWAQPQELPPVDAPAPTESWDAPQELPPGADDPAWAPAEPATEALSAPADPNGPMEEAWQVSPAPMAPSSAPRPPASAPTPGYAPMEARTLIELGASTSTIEEPHAGPFHVGPHGLAISVSGEMLTRMTNLVAVVGSVNARPERKRARGRAIEVPFGEGADQMQRMTGHGVVHLEMGGARFHALDLDDNDGAYLREERVFGFEESIGFEHGRLTDDENKLFLELVHLSGDGRVLLKLSGAMKSLAVPPGAPMVVPLQRLVGWFGRVSPRLTGFAGQGAVELTGDGYALLVTPG
jgi:Flp pilus assembly protein TadD/uncharacterized protein (AIM24 family)